MTDVVAMRWPGYRWLVSRHVEGPYKGKIVWTAYRRLDDGRVASARGVAASQDDGIEAAERYCAR